MNADSSSHVHHPGIYKQQNKSHKHGRHRSKGCLAVMNKGRVNHKVSVKKLHKVCGKDMRRNQAQQLRKKKRDELVQQLRKRNDAPILVTLVSLSEAIDQFSLLERIRTADRDATVEFADKGYVHIGLSQLKRRFTIILADTNRICHTLDAAKVADTVIFLVSVGGFSENSDLIMASLLAQGIPNVLFSLVDLHNLPIKKRHCEKQYIQKIVNQWMPDEKLLPLENENDVAAIFRKLASQKSKSVIYRDRRPYVLVEEINFVMKNQEHGNVLKLSGYVRGQTLSANDLVHVVGWADFQITRLEIKIDRCAEGARIEVPDANVQATLDSENIPDPMDAEQTWPTSEELKEAARCSARKMMKKVPHGTSEYQAAWIPDCDAEEVLSDGDSTASDEEKMDERFAEREASESEDEGDIAPPSMTGSETRTVTFGSTVDISEYDRHIDCSEELLDIEKIKKAREDQLFPDEIDTPMDIPAKERFQKFRGLKSFRTSPWDSKEQLPSDYARIFQFENFARTKKRIIKELPDKIGASVGNYVHIYLSGVSEEEYNSIDRTCPILVVGLLPHEQRMSVLNVVLQQPSINQERVPIASKDELIFQCGFRRFKNRPIFSSHTTGNLQKYERFFQPEATVVATMYAPVVYPPCPVLVFRENEDTSLELVATGSVLSTNPDRIVVKRVVLSGHPFKVNKRSVVVRFMFFNREDIEWFKPVELRTKYGRRGHIKEPLGTHGHMKCNFDHQLNSQDTVLMYLYKRIFPKWAYSKLNTISHVDHSNGNEMVANTG